MGRGVPGTKAPGVLNDRNINNPGQHDPKRKGLIPAPQAASKDDDPSLVTTANGSNRCLGTAPAASRTVLCEKSPSMTPGRGIRGLGAAGNGCQAGEPRLAARDEGRSRR